MLIQRLAIAAVFLAAAAAVVFGDNRLFVVAWLLAVPVIVWVLFRRVVRVKRGREAVRGADKDPDLPTR
jgi:hypothetical protein